MPKVKIVTDSSSDLSPNVARGLGISVIPLNIRLGKKVFRDGVDMTSLQFLRRLRKSAMPPIASPPSARAFQEVYEGLVRVTDQILSIHISSELSPTVQVASQATEAFLGRCRIEVMDSRLTSTGLAMLATVAAEAAAAGTSLEEIIRLMRGMIPHIYMVFFVETLDYLERGGWLAEAQALLGSMLGIKPMLIIEDGEIVPLEKVRTRVKAIEKLGEFVTELTYIQRLVILQSTLTEDAQLLAERINLAKPTQKVEFGTYGPVLTSYIGPDAMGVVVYEGT